MGTTVFAPCLAFRQLTYRGSLRDIEACLSAQSARLYRMGIGSPIRRSTLADANERRDWRIYAEFAHRLIAQARELCAEEDLGLDFDRLVTLHDAGAFFVTRAKVNSKLRRIYSAPSERTQGIICDQTVALSGFYSQKRYPHHLRRIQFKDPETAKKSSF